MTNSQDLVDSHYQSLYRFGVLLECSSTRASELVQQTFTRWAETGDEVEPKIGLFNLLYREHLKSEPVPEDCDAGPPEAMTALGRLDEKFRAPLALLYLQNHQVHEIANVLEIPVLEVMKRISEGKTHLGSTSR